MEMVAAVVYNKLLCRQRIGINRVIFIVISICLVLVEAMGVWCGYFCQGEEGAGAWPWRCKCCN